VNVRNALERYLNGDLDPHQFFDSFMDTDCDARDFDSPAGWALRFSELSVPRERLVRICQMVNYGSIRRLEIKHADPPAIAEGQLPADRLPCFATRPGSLLDSRPATGVWESLPLRLKPKRAEHASMETMKITPLGIPADTSRNSTVVVTSRSK
jgi:hypothetical protein